MGGEAFGYDGKRVLVVGGASGMGAAAAQTAADLGAEVIVLDVADVPFPVAQALKVDLRNQVSVDAAVAEIAGPLHAAFLCAGVADGTAGIMLINFIAQRHLLEQLRADGKIARGSGIVMISSLAGVGWERNLPTLLEFLKQPAWGSAVQWIDDHDGTDSYAFSKQAINTYVAYQSFPLLKDGIRINAVLPGPTDTPLARANADVWLTFGAEYREQAGVEALSPQQVAQVMVFLASPAASGVNGITMLVDAGHVGAGMTGSYDDPIIKAIVGVG